MSNQKTTKSLPIYMTVYASFFDIHAQLPILALFAFSVGADPFWIGAIIGIYSIFNIVGNGLGGIMIDRWGWRKPLLIGLVLVNVALYGFQFVNSTISLLLIRAFNGFAGGLLIPSTLAALSPKAASEFRTEHNKSVALYGISIGLAAFMGPPFAGIISGIFGFKAAYLGIAIIMTLAAFMSFLFTKSEGPTSTKAFEGKMSLYFRLPVVSLKACLLGFALMSGTGTLAAFLPILSRNIGFNQGGIGMLFGGFALMVVLMQGWRGATGWQKFRLYNVAISGVLTILMALLLLHFVTNQILFALAVILFGIGYGMIFPTILVMVIQGISVEKKGIITGIFFAFYSMGTASVPPIAGYIWRHFSGWTPPLTAVVVILMIITLVHILHVRTNHKTIIQVV